MLNKNTKKLFFDQFVYKISFSSSIAGNFRKKDLETIKNDVDFYIKEARKNNSDIIEMKVYYNYRTITVHELQNTLEILNVLKTENNHLRRIEGKVVSVYTNNETLINAIREVTKDSCKLIVKPVNNKIKDYLLNSRKKIITKTYTHKYKVTVNPLKEKAINFKTWASNIPKIKLVTGSSYKNEGVFYVSDLKILNMCRLFLGDRIRRIDELVKSDEI